MYEANFFSTKNFSKIADYVQLRMRIITSMYVHIRLSNIVTGKPFDLSDLSFCTY